ncbi:MAG: TlpA family protein disulfide reductase [Prevotella sp.]|nr:TlpA family protein disulfide reductase [Prevotella sp.]
MNKKVIFTALLALVAIAGQAKKGEKVWNDVVTSYTPVPTLKVTQVGFYNDRTDVVMRIYFPRKGYQWDFPIGDMLKADGKEYPIKGFAMKEGLNKEPVVFEKDKKYSFQSDTLYMIFTFEPLPMNTKKFDYVSPDGFSLLNIRNADCVPDGIADTYWRNDATGDWLIGFAPKHVIYRNQVWDIASQIEKKDAYTLTLTDGTTIRVGKLKKGVRTIAVGNEKPIVCSPITGKNLPDYSTKDLSAFKDNGYQNDTVTIVGWLKDMPKEAWQKGKEIEVQASSIFFIHKNVNAYGKLDSLGRFEVRMPIENTQMVSLDWERLYAVSILEPGETYFFLHDFKTGQQLMMGSNARVQNEIFAHRFMEGMEYEQPDNGMTAERVIAFKDKWKGMYERNTARLDALLAAHPTYSRRFEDYHRMSLVCNMAEQVMMSSMHMKEQNFLPAEVTEYVDSTLWKNMRKPYTIDRINFLLSYHLYNAKNANPEMRQQMLLPESLRKMEEKGLVEFTDEEHEIIDTWEQMYKDYQGASQSEYQELDKRYEGMKDKIVNLTESDKMKEAVPKHFNPFATESELIDSLYADPDLRDICKARMFCQQMDETRYPLSEKELGFIDEIKSPTIRQKVLSVHEKYLALQNKDFANAASLRPSTDVENMTDGEKILRKIIEPYKGRLIYVDIWGTWCSPCKAALKESHKLKDALKDYDIVYLYLANRSSDESWKNVIKEYDLTGENCVHYNLPADQQSAVERYIGINGYPTYKLIDKDGNIHDLDWRHHEDLNAFREIIAKFSGK